MRHPRISFENRPSFINIVEIDLNNEKNLNFIRNFLREKNIKYGSQENVPYMLLSYITNALKESKKYEIYFRNKEALSIFFSSKIVFVSDEGLSDIENDLLHKDIIGPNDYLYKIKYNNFSFLYDFENHAAIIKIEDDTIDIESLIDLDTKDLISITKRIPGLPIIEE